MKQNEINKFKELINGANYCIVATDKGKGLFGKGKDIINLFGTLGELIKDSKIPKQAILLAFELGYLIKEDKNLNLNKNTNLDKLDKLKEILKELEELL